MPLHAAQPGQVYIIKAALFPHFQFEWHPSARRVYLTRIGATVGEPIAFEITTHGDAQNAVLIWLRGYRQAKLEIDAPDMVLQTT